MKIMQKMFIILLSFFSAAHAHDKLQPAPTLTFSVAPTQRAKLNLMLGIVGDLAKDFFDVVDVIKKDLEFSGQFNVTIRQFQSLNSKKEVSLLFEQGYSMAIFLNETPHHHAIDWRLYDTTQAVMLKGSKYTKRGHVLRGWGHNVADDMWVALTGQEGFFSTKIAYCKNARITKKRTIKHVYVADYDGSNEQQLVNVPTVSVAPRWNHDAKNPLVFYSEYTNSNVRMVAVNMHKKRRIASNFDGVNMLPAFSIDGKRVVYCASRGDGNCQLYCYDQGELKKLTHNAGNNVSPTFSDDGLKIFFCSDAQTGKPQIYCHDLVTSSLERLTQDGYCAAPSYCGKKNRIVYSKIIQGIMQLCIYDLVTKEHTQLTFDRGHKEECSWSPCGNYLLFSVEEGERSKIAMLNLLTNDRKYVTDSKYVCSYPSWSPVYDEFPVVA